MSLKSTADRPATCHRPVQPGMTDKPAAMPFLILFELVWHARPRTDEAHVAFQDVKQAAAVRRGSSCRRNRPIGVTRGSSVIFLTPFDRRPTG